MSCARSVPILLAACIARAAAACPDSLPGEFSAEPVGEQMVVNGMPMAIRQVTAKGAPAELLERVERLWKDEKFDVRRHRAGEWEVIAAHGEDCLATLQLVARGGSFGYFGVSQPSKAQAWLPRRLGLTLPGGIELNSSVASVDSGRHGHTVAFSTRRAVDDIDTYFMKHLVARGWQGVSSHELRGDTGRRARVVSAQKGREQLSIVLWNDGLTRALLNLSETP